MGTLIVQIGQKGGSVCMPTSQSRARMGVCRRVYEAKGAPSLSILTGKCQQKMHIGMLKKGKQSLGV